MRKRFQRSLCMYVKEECVFISLIVERKISHFHFAPAAHEWKVSILGARYPFFSDAACADAFIQRL